MNTFLVNVTLWKGVDMSVSQIMYETENDRLSKQDIFDIRDYMRKKNEGFEPIITYIYRLK